jgi:hypothetical protein
MKTRDEKSKAYFKEAKKIFKYLEQGGASSLYSGDYPTSGKIRFAHQYQSLNHFLKARTKYRGNKFIHFTSVEAAIEIIRTGILRLYDLNNMNDPDELLYAIKDLGIELADVEGLKKFHFVASFCKAGLSEEDEFLMWQLYGRNGNGVGIVFEITNPEAIWDSVYFGPVLYGTKNPLANKFLSFYEFHKSFNEQNHLFENEPSLFRAFAMYLKRSIWRHEHEFRLAVQASYNRFTFEKGVAKEGDSQILNDIKHSINRNGSKVAFIEYDLNFKNAREDMLRRHDADLVDRYINSIPHLKVDCIKLGYQINKDVEYNCYQIFDLLAKQKLGYSVNVQFSPIKEYFK